MKVLYRLREADHIAYLVGGSVRDLLLGRRPKDFDIGTSAHPYQVKKLFRNCWIIGRRFRLAHVKFGQKVIEVATFRRQVQPIFQNPASSFNPRQPVTALLSAPLDSEALAANLYWIVNSDDMRAKLARRGLANVRRFTWSATANQLIDLYQSLAATA